MQQFYTPLAIVFAGALIAGTVIYSNQTDPVRVESNQKVPVHTVTPERDTPLSSPKRSDNRYTYGDADAAITVIEFSDYECPFCARHHPTLQQIVDETEGEVVWEYRHLPLSIHPNAFDAAVAAECVGELAGNDAFWKFSSFLFEHQRSLGLTTYKNGAVEHGIDAETLTSCMERNDIAERIKTDMTVAASLGGSGTPFNVIVYADGTSRAVSGALPYAQFKDLIAR